MIWKIGAVSYLLYALIALYGAVRGSEFSFGLILLLATSFYALYLTFNYKRLHSAEVLEHSKDES